MEKYIVLDENGYPVFPILFKGYDEIPDNAIRITDEEEYHYLSNQYKNNGMWVDIPISEPTLDELKQEKLNEVTAWTEQKIVGGFVANVNGKDVAYDSDKETQLTVQGILLNGDKLADYYPNGAPIRGVVEGESEKTIQWLSAEQLFAWQAALSLHVGTCKQLGWVKQQEVANATTKEELDNIVLD